MVGITVLWLPILISAVLVFLASGLIHMVLNLHKNDFDPLPGEESIARAMREAGVQPGDYAIPCPKTMKEMQSPEVMKKYEEGPVGFVTIAPSGSPGMGSSLAQWFVFCLVIGVFVAYLTGRTVAPGSEYKMVFRMAGTVAFLGYAGALPLSSIWSKRKWSHTLRHIFDGLIYALLTAGAFAGFYPD